jgi:oligo-1,6-glucosidase
MQWDASENSGFTPGRPWLPVNPNFAEINAEAAMADPTSVWHHYRALIALRHDEPAVALGDFTMLLPDDERVYAYTRRLADVVLLVVANLSAANADVPIADAAGWAESELLLGNYPDSGNGLRLRPWEARIYRRLDPTSGFGRRISRLDDDIDKLQPFAEDRTAATLPPHQRSG